MKRSSTQYDDRIVEATWSAGTDNWVIRRIRDDKVHGNHSTTVQSILKCIINGVEASEVCTLFDHLLYSELIYLHS